ncbi:MAG TPA: hypothetical protein VIF57_24615 [Polyangia bacterium]
MLKLLAIPGRRRWLFALAAAALAGAASLISVTPVGCASSCGSNCPITTVTISTTTNVDPGILDIAWLGPACPNHTPGCRGDDQTTFCNRIDVTGSAPGNCDVLIDLYGREPMVVHLTFGPATTQGCCAGYPVIGDYRYIIPVPMDGGIYSGDGNTDAVSILRDAGIVEATPAPDAGGDTAADDAGGDTDAD